jgi:hypothetical protein
MERNDTDEVVRLARRAYELGRLRSALRVVVFVVPMVGLALLGANGPAAVTLVTGALLYLVSVALLWRGKGYGRAASAGLLAGSVPLLVPMLLRSGASCCIGGGCWSMCMPICIATGLVAGLVIGFRGAQQREHSLSFTIAAMVVAGLAGSLGCRIIGAAGILGMVGGVIAGSTPLALGAALRARS